MELYSFLCKKIVDLCTYIYIYIYHYYVYVAVLWFTTYFVSRIALDSYTKSKLSRLASQN